MELGDCSIRFELFSQGGTYVNRDPSHQQRSENASKARECVADAGRNPRVGGRYVHVANGVRVVLEAGQTDADEEV